MEEISMAESFVDSADIARLVDLLDLLPEPTLEDDHHRDFWADFARTERGNEDNTEAERYITSHLAPVLEACRRPLRNGSTTWRCTA